MIYKTLEGVLNPDGQVILPREELPEHSVRVMVTIMEMPMTLRCPKWEIISIV